MANTHAVVKVSVYDTPAEIYNALARVVPEQTNSGTRWVNLDTSDIQVTFFAAAQLAEAEPLEAVEIPA